MIFLDSLYPAQTVQQTTYARHPDKAVAACQLGKPFTTNWNEWKKSKNSVISHTLEARWAHNIYISITVKLLHIFHKDSCMTLMNKGNLITCKASLTWWWRSRHQQESCQLLPYKHPCQFCPWQYQCQLSSKQLHHSHHHQSFLQCSCSAAKPRIAGYHSKHKGKKRQRKWQGKL